MLLHKSQAYQYENGPPISSFQGPSNAVPRFKGGPKVVMSDETSQMFFFSFSQLSTSRMVVRRWILILFLCVAHCCMSRSLEASSCSASGVCTARDKDRERTEAVLFLQRRKLEILTVLQGQEKSKEKLDVNKLQRELDAIDSETASLVFPTSSNTMTMSAGQRIRQASDLSLHQYMEKSVQYETNYTIADARFTPFKIRYLRRNSTPVLGDRGNKGQSPGRNHGTPSAPAIVRTVSVLDFHGRLHFLLRRDRELAPSAPSSSIEVNGDTVDRTNYNNNNNNNNNNIAYDNERSMALVTSEIREVFTLDLEHNRNDDTGGSHSHVTAWIFEGKDVESPMVVSAGVDGHVHVSFLQVFNDVGTIVAGRRVSSTIVDPMSTFTSKATDEVSSHQSNTPQSNAPPVDGTTMGGSKGGTDVGISTGPNQPTNEGDEWSVDGRVQYRFRVPLLSPTPTADSTLTDNAINGDSPLVSLVPYVTAFCVGQLRGGQSVQVYAGDSVGDPPHLPPISLCNPSHPV